jgi:hypothetical protein
LLRLEIKNRSCGESQISSEGRGELCSRAGRNRAIEEEKQEIQEV